MARWEDLPLLSTDVAQAGVYDSAANPIGDDPETYLDSSLDPSAAITEAARMPYLGYTTAGLHNGDFNQPPPVLFEPVDDQNPIPFWQARQPTGGGSIVVVDGSERGTSIISGYAPRLRLSNPTTNDEVSLIQRVPIATWNFTDLMRIHALWGQVTEDVSGQIFVKYSTRSFENGAVLAEATATADVADLEITTPWFRPTTISTVVQPYYVQIEIGLKALASGAGTTQAYLDVVMLAKPPERLIVGGTSVSDPTQPALHIGQDAGGTAVIEWGAGGTAVSDIRIYRIQADLLGIDDAIRVTRAGAGGDAVQAWITSESEARFILEADGDLLWGDGSAAHDIRLERSAANTLELANGDTLSVENITVRNSGTWTPVLTFATPGNLSVAYSEQDGRYEKVGIFVFYTCRLTTSTFTHTTASGNLQVTGLPITPISITSPGGLVQMQGWTKANYTAVAAAATTSSLLVFPASGSGQNISNIAAADMPTGGSVIIRVSGFYLA